MVEAAASARGMTERAAGRAAALEIAHASVARLTEQMDGVEARAAELGGQLAQERAARQVATHTFVDSNRRTPCPHSATLQLQDRL